MIDYISLGRTPYIGLRNNLGDEDYRIIEKISLLLGIDSILGVSFNKLSGGQKQMSAIARSLIQDTPIIVMDEPMSALDIGTQVCLLNVLYNFSKEGKTIILTTHNPNHALAIDSEACFMKHGEIISLGKSKDIISDKLLQEVYGHNIMLDHGERADSVIYSIP